MSCRRGTGSVDGEWRAVFVIDAVCPDVHARGFWQSKIIEGPAYAGVALLSDGEDVADLNKSVADRNNVKAAQ